MKWYLASYPSYCYLTLSRTKFQQFFLYALCHGYFKNPSGKYKIISGEKCVISLHEDSAGVESAMQWEEFNIPVCSLWRCWCGWTVSCLGSNSPGTCHGHIPCARTPCCTIPDSFLFCYNTIASEGFHMFIKEPGALHTPPPEVRGLCLQFGSKRKGGLGLGMHRYSQESRIHLFWKS